MPQPASSSEPELKPLSVGELSRIIHSRFVDRGAPLQIVGGRTSLLGLGPDRVPSETLTTTGLARVVDYPARDMTITVEAGLRVDELQATLEQQGQTLPIDIPAARRATIGGAMAANVSGPGRYGYGTFRDYLIGVRAVDGRGRPFAAGGRVVKNVAGYDLCKLLVGSEGRLAVIAEVTLKVRPRPESRALVWLQMDDWAALDRALEGLTRTETRPIAVEVLNTRAARQLAQEARLILPGQGPVLCVAYDGSATECEWQTQTFMDEASTCSPRDKCLVAGDDSARLWEAFTEYQTASDEPLTFRAAIRPSHLISLVEAATERGIAVQAHAGNGVLIGHFPDSCTERSQAAELIREIVRLSQRGEGSVNILRCDSGWWPHLAGETGPKPNRIVRRLKEALDPLGILNPHLETPESATTG